MSSDRDLVKALEKVPTNDQGEHCLLAAMVLDPARVVPAIQPIVSEADFGDPDLRWLFGSLITLHESGKPIGDFVAIRPLLSELSSKAPGTFSWEAYFVRLVNFLPYAAHAPHYAQNVKRASRLRKLQGIGADLLVKVASGQANPDDIGQWLEGAVAKLDGKTGDQPQTLFDASLQVIEELESSLDAPKKAGAMSGIFDLDQVIGPVMPGEMCIVAARPGCGKTALATQIAIHSAQKNRPAFICSLEMRQKELATRILCQEASVNSTDIRRGHYDAVTLLRMREAAESHKGLPIRLWAPRGATMADIRGQARYQKVTNGLDLLVIDYLGLVKVSGADRALDRHLQVQTITVAAKELAKELDIPVYLLCQLNRQGDGEEPELKHLRESGSIEQDADMVLMLHHGKLRPNERNEPHDAQVIIGKHRHGASGAVTIQFIPRETRFACRDVSVPAPSPTFRGHRAPSRHAEFDQFQ